MTLPQGINFRATTGFVTDGTGEEYEVGTTANFPRTTAQGNNVGWESPVTTNARDRTTGNDRRLAGVHFWQGGEQNTYRIDLPGPGTYNIRAAAGDANFGTGVFLAVVDGASSLGTLFDGSTGAANSYMDASGVVRTQAAWPGSNVAISKTFASSGPTICRFKIGKSGVNFTGSINHLYIESAGGAAQTITVSLDAAIQRQVTLATTLGAAIQVSRTLTTSADAAIQQTRTAQAVVDVAVQAQRTLTASVDAAVRTTRTATASLDAYVQAGFQVTVSLDAAIQRAQSVAAAIDAAIQQGRVTTVSLDAVIAERFALSATIDAAIQMQRSVVASLDAYIDDPGALPPVGRNFRVAGRGGFRVAPRGAFGVPGRGAFRVPRG